MYLELVNPINMKFFSKISKKIFLNPLMQKKNRYPLKFSAQKVSVIADFLIIIL